MTPWRVEKKSDAVKTAWKKFLRDDVDYQKNVMHSSIMFEMKRKHALAANG